MLSATSGALESGRQGLKVARLENGTEARGALSQAGRISMDSPISSESWLWKLELATLLSTGAAKLNCPATTEQKSSGILSLSLTVACSRLWSSRHRWDPRSAITTTTEPKRRLETRPTSGPRSARVPSAARHGHSLAT